MNPSITFKPAMRGITWARAACAALAASMTFFALAGCGGSDDAVVDRGPTTIEVSAKLNGLYWDSAASRLYLTDDDTAANAIKTWDGEKAFSVAYQLPAMAADQRPTLGQVTRGTDGNLYTTRFGFGSYGTVVVAPKTGQPYNLTGLAGDRRRLPITPTTDGKLLTGWFRGGGSGPSGVISEVTLGSGTQASERDLITGLSKPAGLALVGDQLFVSDQGAGKILAYSLAAVRAQPGTAGSGRVVVEFTSADSLDLITASTDGTLYFGSGAGSLYSVDSKGVLKTLASGWPGIRGVALDTANKRLFVAVTAEKTDGPASIRIVPID
jgi:sugar lactone lactonase YvrE